MKIAHRMWGFCFAAIIVMMAVPAFGFGISNALLAPPQLTIRFAPSPGSFPDEVSGVRTGIFGFRIDEFPEPVPPAGYVFIGWFSDGVQMSAPIAAVRSTTILAGFAPIINSDIIPSFSVMFNLETGQLPQGTRPIQSLTYGSALTSLPVPVQEGYYFIGWQLNGSIITVPFIVRSDMALEAVWSETPIQQSSRPIGIPDNQFVAVFNPFPGAFSDNETGMRFGRFAATMDDLPQEPVRQGYIFYGWGLPNGEILDAPLAMRSNIMLMAVWEEDPDSKNNGTEASSRPPIESRPNPPTNPITISLVVFGAVGMLGATSAGIHILNTRQAAAKSRYRAYITRCVREMKIVIKNRSK